MIYLDLLFFFSNTCYKIDYGPLRNSINEAILIRHHKYHQNKPDNTLILRWKLKHIISQSLFTLFTSKSWKYLCVFDMSIIRF